jgi:hypothetical protein
MLHRTIQVLAKILALRLGHSTYYRVVPFL